MATILDVFADIQTVADDAYLDIQPGAGDEAVIHNIYYEDDIEVSRYDGSLEVIFHTETGAGCLAMYAFHVNNTDRIRVRNVGGESHEIGYDGVYTKAA